WSKPGRRTWSRANSWPLGYPWRSPRRLVLGALLEFLDQGLDLPAVPLDVGIKIRTSSHDHADALDFYVGDPQPLAGVANLPLDADRRTLALVQLAFDQEDAVRTGNDAADGQGLARVLAEALAVGMSLRTDRG